MLPFLKVHNFRMAVKILKKYEGSDINFILSEINLTKFIDKNKD